MAFSSLKVRVGLTANALTMARRVFSWMRRSRSGIRGSTGLGRGASTPAGLFAALATISPCDDESEDDVQAAEAGAEQEVADGKRNETGGHPEDHEGGSHHGNRGDRVGAAADERASI